MTDKNNNYNSNEGDPCYMTQVLFNRTKPNDMPVIRDTSLALSILGYIYCLVSFIRYIYYRREYDHLKKRSIIYVALTTTGVIIQISSGVLNIALDYTCFVIVALSMMVVPVCGLAIPLKLLDHFTKYVYARGVLGLDIDAGPDTNSVDQSRNESWLKAISSTGSFVYSVVFKKTSVKPSNQVTDIVSSPHTSAESRKLKPISMKAIKLLKFLTSTYARWAIAAICLIPFILIVVIDFNKYEYLKPSNDCHGCAVNHDQSTAIFIGGGIIISLGILVAFIVRKYPDPFGIMTECRMSMMYGGITAIVGFYLGNTYPDGTYKNFSFSYVTWFGMIIIQFITTDYQIFIAKRNQAKISKWAKTRNNKSKNLGSVAATETETDDVKVRNLKDLLSSPEATGFEEYLVGEYSVELIRMYQDCRYYEEHFFDMNENTKRAKVKRIITIYISSNSALEVNLPQRVKEAINSALDSSEPISQYLFKDSQNEIIFMLFSPWRRYLAQQEKAKHANNKT